MDNESRVAAQPLDGGGKVKIKTLNTGIPDLDIVLGGGLPEYSFNVIAGAPGSGKTTLAHQIVFANASVCNITWFIGLRFPQRFVQLRRP